MPKATATVIQAIATGRLWVIGDWDHRERRQKLGDADQHASGYPQTASTRQQIVGEIAECYQQHRGTGPRQDGE